MTYTIVCTVRTPDDGQRNCPKHVEFYSKNKLEKLVHLVGFIIRLQEINRPEETVNCGKSSVKGKGKTVPLQTWTGPEGC